MNPFDYFENIYCINLDKRIDRWQESQKEFNSVGILNRVNRFSAIENIDGRVGLVKSYLSLFKFAKEKNMKDILIFEDDIHFINNPQENLSKAIEQMKDIQWSMFYLGANLSVKINSISTNLAILKKGLCTHATVYRRDIFDALINKFNVVNVIKNAADINDVYLAILQEKYLSLIINPIIATQRPSFSSLENKIVDYSFIEERFYKYIN